MSNNSVSSARSSNNKAANGNNGNSKGWFEGTMEVISGMEVISNLAPRPSTPVPNPNLKKRSGGNARGSMSAPSSPARSGASGYFPSINRLPSQDSMDRSTHNEGSTHGKSASQIIKELKQSNASLSAKTAGMEADFMNQLNHQNRKTEEQKRRMEETLKKSEKLLLTLESRCKNAEQLLGERDEQLTKLREEGAFQRHTISDLKNQLHQVELDQEESDYGNRDVTDRWQVEKRAMEQEREDLRAQLQDSQVLQQEVDRLNHKLEEMKLLPVGHGADDESVNSQMGSSQRSSYTHRSFMKQSLPQTRETLKKTKHRLSVTEAALDILKQERARMMHEHEMEVDEMQHQIESAEQAHREREKALQGTIQLLEKQDKSRDNEMNSSIDGPSAADKEAQQTIQGLQEQVEEYAAQVADLTSKLDKVKSDSKNQEQYRADEAEDLRVLHDAQEEEIERLRKELDDLNRELELRDQELEEQKIALEKTTPEKDESPEDTVEEPTEDTTVGEDVEPVEVANLKQRLQDSEAAIERLETTLDTTRQEHHNRVEHLETVLHEVTEGKEDAEEQLAQISAVLVVNQSRQTSRSAGESSDSEESELPPHDASKAVDLTIMLRNVEQLQENERKSAARVKELEFVQAELDELRNSRQNETQELEELVARLKESEEKLASTRDGAMEEYRSEIQKLRAQLKAKDSQRVQKLDEQLREAQSSLSETENEKTALVEEYMAKIKRLEEENANDKLELEIFKEEKAAMLESHMKTLQQLDDGKSVLEGDFEARVKARGDEISELKQALEHATSDKDRLQKQLDNANQEKQALIQSHRESLSALQNEKHKIEVSFQEKLAVKEAELANRQAEEPTAHSDQVALLKQEVEKLQKQLLEEQVEQHQRQLPAGEDSSGHQSGGAVEADLRKQLELMKREKEENGCTFKEKLEDRDTTISALVKSSVGLEQKISQLNAELQTLRNDGRSGSMVPAERSTEEAFALREALSDYKEVEKRLLHELGLTKRQLKFAESEISRLQEVMDDEMSVDSHHYRRQIQERDDAVSALVQQSMSHESEMHRLKERLQATSSELDSFKTDKTRSSSQLRAELRRLHQESEIFAGQIIEQDEELEALRSEIHNRDEKIVALNRQLNTARGPNYRPGMLTPDGESPEVVSLRAQIDELEEANETYRVELRDLRFKLRDSDNLRNELARAKFDLDEYEHKAQAMAGSQEELQAAIDAKVDAEHQLEGLLALNQSNSQACDMLARERDALVGQRDKIIEDLRRNIDGSTSQIDALETEIDALRKELRQQSEAMKASEENAKNLLAQAAENRSIDTPDGETERGALFEEVEELQNQVRVLESENAKLAQYKDKMTEVESVQEQSGKMAQAYERKLSLLSLDKDATIDSLQKALMEIKGQATEDFEAMARDLKKMDLENQTLRKEMEGILEKKDNQIFALEHTLDAQEQLVGNMRSEMDHLQGSMANNVYSRREEFEDMEKEVLDLTTRNAAYEREITSLKMQVEENKLASLAEVAKLKETVERMSQEAPEINPAAKPSPIESFPIHEVKERLEKLRFRNNSIQEENFKLKSRLEKAEVEIQTARNEQYRTATLEAKLGVLTKQMASLEKENAAKSATSTSEKPPMGGIVPPESPQRSRIARSLPGSRSGTPQRSSRNGTPQQREETQAGSRPSSKPGSRQATPQRKRTPLRPRQSAQKQQAPDTPGSKKRNSFFGFRRKSDRENPDEATQAKQQYLVPPSNPQPKAPTSSKSLQSAS